MDVINGVTLRNMLLVAARNLDQQKDIVNALNVFPVPDGDTGTNMSLTLNAAVKELERAENNEVGRLTTLLARGSLMGARGNSGVILSQFGDFPMDSPTSRVKPQERILPTPLILPPRLPIERS